MKAKAKLQPQSILLQVLSSRHFWIIVRVVSRVIQSAIDVLHAGTPQVTDAGLQALCALRALGTLDLSGCVSITDRGLSALSSHLRRLHTLKLGGTSRVATISNASVAAIAGITSLTHLDLSGSHDITDEGVPDQTKEVPSSRSSSCCM